MSALEVASVGSMWAVTTTTIAASSDLAFVSFLIKLGEEVCKCTAVLRILDTADGEWKLSFVHQAKGVPVADVKIPKSL